MKYIFIDSNQYRHIFSRSEGFSDKIYELLIKLIDHKRIILLLPQQTKDEVERDRYGSWPENEIQRIENKLQRCKKLLEKIDLDYMTYKSSKTIKSEINKEMSKLNTEKEIINKSFTNKRSKQNQKLKKLFIKAVAISETKEILENATFRRNKGNPPHNHDNGIEDINKIGDQIIWESLITYLKDQHRTQKTELIFVANDNKAWGSVQFDSWLKDEFRDKVHGRVIYVNKLSDIPELTKIEQVELGKEEKEEEKKNAILDFANSSGWAEAGRLATNLLQYKESFTNLELEMILKAAVMNNQISGSFFTKTPLTELVNGDGIYVDLKVERVTREIWEKFYDEYKLKLNRHSDEELGSARNDGYLVETDLNQPENQAEDTPF